ICLAAGTYSLPAPLRLTSAHTNITLKACRPGSVRLQAQAGNESSFNDGLIVLDNVTAFTLSGIDLLVPVAFFTGTFAGLAATAMPSDVASMAGSLVVSIGVRIINGSEITITDCAFGVASRGLASNQQRPSALFSAGIFASGQNDGIRVEGNQFILNLRKEIITADNFIAGFVLSSTVSFITNVIQVKQGSSAPAPPTHLQANVDETAKANVNDVAPNATTKAAKAKKSQAQVKQPNIAPRIADLPASDLSSIGAATEAGEPKYTSGLQLVGGELQNIGKFGTFNNAAATLASQGGNVLAATLDDSTFRDNVFERLTCAALILGEPGTIDVLSNQVEACHAGFWFVTPAEAQNLLYDPQNLALLGATIALGYPLPQNDTSTNSATVEPAPSSIRIYAGSKPYTDSSGNVWSPDASATNVTVSGGTTTTPMPLAAIIGSSDAALYQSERYGNSFSYTFNNLVNGYYSLKLRFAEIFYTNNSTNKGVRVFNVSINGEQVLTNFDIASDAGGADYPDDSTFYGIAPNSAQQIVVQFTGTSIGSDQNAKIDAAELDPQWTGASTLGSGNESDTASFFDQLAQLAYQGYATLGYSLGRLRIDNNE
ncbi:MAG: malectin domain-containing carbohydrate-binding protein, partial [Acidobacteriaceae bacterium]